MKLPFHLVNGSVSENKLREALTHPSILSTNQSIPTYEHLETIGDAVLSLIVLEKLSELSPNGDPEFLTKEKAKIVNNPVLSELGKMWQLDDYVLSRSDYQLVSKDFADLVEAVFGAIYLDAGIDTAKLILDENWDSLQNLATDFVNRWGENPIGQLQELAQKYGNDLPEYRVIKEEGDPHQPIFTIEVIVMLNQKKYQTVVKGNSKQLARKNAAQLVLQEFYNQ